MDERLIFDPQSSIIPARSYKNLRTAVLNRVGSKMSHVCYELK